jgi:hypothetical protein
MFSYVVKQKNIPANEFWLGSKGSIMADWHIPMVQQNMRHCAASEIIAVGAKCGADRDLAITSTWDKEGRTSRLKQLLLSIQNTTSVPRIIFMYRNNTLDWVVAAGAAKGSDHQRVPLRTNGLIDRLKQKMKDDQLMLTELQHFATVNNFSFMTAVYEHLCSNRNEEMTKIYHFLGLRNQSLIDIANAKPDDTVKKHTHSHREMFTNYNEVETLLTKAGLQGFLRDEECSAQSRARTTHM